MQSDADFDARRLSRQLTTDHGEAGSSGAAPAASLTSEAAIMAVADNADFVRQAYRFFLRRDPDSGGLRYYCDMVQMQGRLTVIAEIKNSHEAQRYAPTTSPDSAPESQARPVARAWIDPAILDDGPELADLMDIDDAETFVTAAYRRTLGRDPDPDGEAHHLSQLRAGGPRAAMLQSLALSDEARRRGMAFTWQGTLLPGAGLGARVRAMATRVLPGAGHRRAMADLRRAMRRFERWLFKIHSEKAQLERMVQTLSADTGPSHAIAALSSQMAAETQHAREAHQSLQITLDALASRVEAGITRGARASVMAGDNVVASEVEGFVIGVPGEEWRLAAHHTFRGVLEPGLTRRFRETVRPGMVVIDVGAYVGMYTLLAARLVGPSGRVFSFEPAPRTFAILKDNIQINGFLESGYVQFNRVAITDRIGTARFPEGRDAACIDVETTTLDAALAGVSRVDVIKIDAEGAEPLIWAGMTATLARNPGVQIFMAFAPALLERGGHEPAGFLARIKTAGFQVHLVDDGTGAIRKCTDAELCRIASSTLRLTKTDR